MKGEDCVFLVQEWQEAELDKSLPMSEGPLEDMEGLVPVAVKVLHPGIAETFRWVTFLTWDLFISSCLVTTDIAWHVLQDMEELEYSNITF